MRNITDILEGCTHVIVWRGFTVEVDDSTQYATVRDSDGKPVGTLMRKRVYERGPAWRGYDLDGFERTVAHGPRTALHNLIRLIAGA